MQKLETNQEKVKLATLNIFKHLINSCGKPLTITENYDSFYTYLVYCVCVCVCTCIIQCTYHTIVVSTAPLNVCTVFHVHLIAIVTTNREYIYTQDTHVYIAYTLYLSMPATYHMLYVNFRR